MITNKLLAVSLAPVLLLASTAAGEVIVSTSFEGEPLGAQYVDTGDASQDHDLVNNTGQSVVDSTVGGAGILGFDASYRNTRNGVGLTDGDFVGVTDFTGAVGAYTDGSQGYQMADPDGLMSLAFDVVDISSAPEVMFSLDLFVQETGWESDDLIRIFATVDGTEFDLLNTAGSDIDDLAIEGSWQTVSGTFAGNSAFLTVELDSNAGTEAIFLDNVSISAIPEPSSLAVLGFVACGLTFQRRRKQ